MIKCPECGEQASDGAKFCDRCGRGLDPAAAVAAPVATRPPALAAGTILKGKFQIVEPIGGTSIENRYRARRIDGDGPTPVILRERFGPTPEIQPDNADDSQHEATPAPDAATATPELKAEQDPPLTGARVYIAPLDGFEVFLTAAFEKKGVPMTVVTNRAEADYILQGTSQSQKSGWARTIFTGETGSSEQASVELVDPAGKVIWAYSVKKGNSVHGQQSTAEACAKHLKSEIEKLAKQGG